MDIVIRPTAEHVHHLAAEVIADAIRSNPRVVLGLPTGRTMLPVYAELVRRHREEGLDFGGLTTFNLDEYAGLDENDPRSFRAYMRKNLFEAVNLQPQRCHLPDGSADDLARACREYEERISAAGGIDLQVLGVGMTGHIGFNEPGSSLHSRTRTKALSEITRLQNASAFGGGEHVPQRAVTMGIGTILDARRCLLITTGEAKAVVVSVALEGPVTASVPASALQFHPRCDVILDEAAASRLRNVDYYVATYAIEPEWAPYRERGL